MADSQESMDQDNTEEQEMDNTQEQEQQAGRQSYVTTCSSFYTRKRDTSNE